MCIRSPSFLNAREQSLSLSESLSLSKYRDEVFLDPDTDSDCDSDGAPGKRHERMKWLEEAVGRILYPEGRRPFIWAARYHTARAANPGTSPTQGGMRGQTTLGPPIRPCSAWGLPCPLRFRRGGALLPHPFTLTPGLTGGGLLSAALSLALPRPGVTRHAVCHGVRTFL